MENSLKVCVVPVLACLWYGLFRVIDTHLRINLKPSKLLEVKNNLIAGIHGTIISWMCLTAFLLKTPRQLK